MINLIRKLFLKLLYKRFVQKVKCVTVEQINDNGLPRNIDVMWLMCGHTYWQEQNLSKSERLCETCLMNWCVDRWGGVEGMRMFKRWERWGKVRV